MAQIQTDGGKKQCKWNRQSNDDGVARIAEKQEKNNHDQNHSFGEVMHDGARRVVHQIVAIQVRNDLHAARQNVIVEPPHHGMDSFECCGRVGTLAHEHDAFHYVTVIDHHAVGSVDGFSDLAQADFWPLGDVGNIFYAQRGAVLGFEDGFFDVADAVNQSHCANIDLLCSLFDKTAAGVCIAVRQLLLDLGETQAVGDQLLGIDANLILAGNSAEGRIVDHVRHRL